MKANKEISQENLTLVFDNDSTLMTGEIVDTLAEILQCEKLISELTNKQMDGNSQQSFAENLQARITILVEKNLEKKHFQQCAEKMTWSENAQKLLKTIIKKQGTLKHNFYIFSGGFTEIIYLKINEFEPKFKTLDDADFPGKTNEFKERVKKGENLDNLLIEVFACAREAAKRTINERPYDVQLIGSLVLHKGKIAEMKTGEGKTLSIVLTAYLNALSGEGVHVVTVNDYLAKRDCLNMGKIYSFLGLKSGYINNDQDDLERKKNYDCDITYATNSELGFDYLRDNMKFSKDMCKCLVNPNSSSV